MLGYLVHYSATVRVHYLHWNSSNPIFRIDNTDHILDVNQGNMPWEYDQVNLICPWYRSGTRGEERDMEKYIIYNVSKEEYDSCRISQEEPRVVAVCDSPDKPQQFTITFRSFSPTPRGLEFHPGKDYFFISTSWKGDLYRKVGGSCTIHNMKVIFKVATPVETETHPTINSPRRQANQNKFPVRPIEDVRSLTTGLGRTEEDSWRNLQDDKQRRNSLVKQEASTMSSSPPHTLSLCMIIIYILLS